MKRKHWVLFALLVVVFTGATIAADPGIRSERLQFDKGATSTSVKGQLKGSSDVDYLVRASAGQTITISLNKSNNSSCFNLLPPGSKDVAMYVGDSGQEIKRVLPTDGDYTIRVYLVRAAARRNEASDYTLNVAVTGDPLAPIAASKDALVPGTNFHASAKIKCVTYLEALGEKKSQEIDAFVIRRGHDGTATVEIPQNESLTRRILFVTGKPITSDSSDPLNFSRKDDVTIVTFDSGERYEIPDAFIFGG